VWPYKDVFRTNKLMFGGQPLICQQSSLNK
jgi:hypothetical protein